MCELLQHAKSTQKSLVCPTRFGALCRRMPVFAPVQEEHGNRLLREREIRNRPRDGNPVSPDSSGSRLPIRGDHARDGSRGVFDENQVPRQACELPKRVASARIAYVCGAKANPHRGVTGNDLLVKPRCQLLNLVEPRDFHSYIVPGTAPVGAGMRTGR